MAERVVTAHGGHMGDPYVVAVDSSQYRKLMDLALGVPSSSNSSTARFHGKVYFYVSDRPVGLVDGPLVTRYARVGFYHGFGGVYFVDRASSGAADWSWVALNPKPYSTPPPVYFDEETDTLFPPAAVMSLDGVRELVLAWMRTGERPDSVQWCPVNRDSWGLTDDGDITDPWPRGESDGLPRYVWMRRPRR